MVVDIQAGQRAPDFTLPAHTGESVSLADYVGNKNVVLYFMREFNCMACRGYAGQLGQMHDQLKKSDTEVLVIGGGKIEDAAALAKVYRLPFPVLADQSRNVYLSYGLDKAFLFIQRSGTVLIDKAGSVRYIEIGANPSQSLRRAELERAVKQITEPAF